MTQGAKWTYLELDNKLFESYIEEKSNPIVGVLEQRMYAGRYDWNRCLSVAGNMIEMILNTRFAYIYFIN